MFIRGYLAQVHRNPFLDIPNRIRIQFVSASDCHTCCKFNIFNQGDETNDNHRSNHYKPNDKGGGGRTHGGGRGRPPPGLRGRDIGMYYAQKSQEKQKRNRTVAHIPRKQLDYFEKELQYNMIEQVNYFRLVRYCPQVEELGRRGRGVYDTKLLSF